MAHVNRVTMAKGRYDEGIKRKQNWLTMYQLVGEYVMTRKQNFLSTSMPGEFLTEQLFSSVAPEANRTMASAILGNLWPNAEAFNPDDLRGSAGWGIAFITPVGPIRFDYGYQIMNKDESVDGEDERHSTWHLSLMYAF